MGIAEILKKMNGLLEVMLPPNDFLEDTVWTFAPTETNASPNPAHFGVVKLWHWLVNFSRLNGFLNNVSAAAPILFLAAFLLLAKTILTLALDINKISKNKKQVTPYWGLKIALDVILIAGLTTLGVFLLHLSLLPIVIIYGITSAIDIVKNSVDLIKNAWDYFSLYRKEKQLRQQEQPIPEENKTNVNKRLEEITAQKKAIIGEVKENLLSLGISIAYGALTILSFLPIPILANVAQYALLGLSAFNATRSIYNRYQDYKAKQAKKNAGDNTAKQHPDNNPQPSPELKPQPSQSQEQQQLLSSKQPQSKPPTSKDGYTQTTQLLLNTPAPSSTARTSDTQEKENSSSVLTHTPSPIAAFQQPIPALQAEIQTDETQASSLLSKEKQQTIEEPQSKKSSVCCII